MPGAPHPMAIGSDTWPGLGKLAEECAETVQVIGKLIAYPTGPHPDGAGPLHHRLEDELGDVLGAIEYVLIANALMLSNTAVRERADAKRKRFLQWHDDERARRGAAA